MGKLEWILLIVAVLAAAFLMLNLFSPVLAPGAEIHGEVEAGYDFKNKLWEFSTYFEIGQPYKNIYPHVFGGWYTLTEKENLGNWLPWVQVYKFGAGITIKDNIVISFVHYCMHPVDLYDRKLLYDYKDFVLQSEDKISVRYTY